MDSNRAACLAMIASHYKINKSITPIREIACTDIKGTNIAGLVIASQKMGFSAKEEALTIHSDN